MYITPLKFQCLLVLVLFNLKFYSQKKDTVRIGSQLWSSKNLNVTRFRNGDLIPQAKTKTEWIKAGKEKKPAWCYYNNDSVLGKKYGKLYNWFAVNDPRDLAPVGWRLPYFPDYAELIKYHEYLLNDMKSLNGWKKNGSNKFGFNIIPSGFINASGKSTYIREYTWFWCLDSIALSIGNDENNFDIISNNNLLTVGGSIRLIKDEGLRKNNDENNKLRIEIEDDISKKKYDSASYKLNHIFHDNNICYKYYFDHKNLLECYVKNNDIVSAEKFYNEKIGDIDSVFEKGVDFHKAFVSALILSNFNQQALKYLKIAVEKYPQDTYLKIELAQAYSLSSEFDKATEIYIDNIDSIYIKGVSFCKTFGRNLILSKNHLLASKYLKIAVEKYPKEIYLKGNLAHSYLLSGNFEKAKKIYIENILKIDSIPWELGEGQPVITNQDFYGKIITDDTTWIKMVKEDFIYFKKEGIHSPYFDSITKILNLKKENAELRKESDGYYYDYIDDTHTIYNDTNGFLCDRNNMIYDSCIYKLKKILASNYFIEEYDYERLLDYYFSKNDLISAESFFNYCIENHKGNEADLYNQYSNRLARFKLYQSAIKYKKIAVEKSPKDLYLKIGLSNLLICSGNFDEAKKIFIDNIVQYDSISGDWIYEDRLQDTLWTIDTIKNTKTFDRIKYEPTTWMELVSRRWIQNQFSCLQESDFNLIEDLMTKEHEALVRKRIALEKEGKK